VFHHQLIKSLLVPALSEEFFVTYVEIINQSVMPIDKILANPASPWFATRPRGELVRSALADACAELTESLGRGQRRWQWGKLHTLTLNHAFSRIGLLRPVFSVGPFPSGGDNFTIDLGFYRHSNPYQHTVGPSMRMIVETWPILRSQFILPSGQSGHPFSQHFRDQTARWQSHNYIELGVNEEQIRHWPLLLLKPAS
jgi:penicillin amidase